MNAFGIICAVLSVAAIAPMIYVLICHAGALNWCERIGLGLLPASTFLSIFKQLHLAHIVAPFDPWYQLVWRVGVVLYFGGHAWRFIKHHIGNSRQARILMLDARERMDAAKG